MSCLTGTPLSLLPCRFHVEWPLHYTDTPLFQDEYNQTDKKINRQTPQRLREMASI